MLEILLIILSFNTKIVPVSQSHRDIIEMYITNPHINFEYNRKREG